MTNLQEKVDEYMDRVAVSRMNLLTWIGQRCLPKGYWGDKAAISPGLPNGSNSVYLTFDDGPSPETTPWLLELLAEEQAKATFFLIGSQAERYPDLVAQIHRDGHEIGNHSYSHRFMPGLSSKSLVEEIDRTNKQILEITGAAPRIFRPPYGIIDNRAAGFLVEREMRTIYWSSAPEDWSIPGTQRVIRRVLWQLSAGSLIVLHEGDHLAKQTISAAKEIIYRCKIAEYDLTKVDAGA